MKSLGLCMNPLGLCMDGGGAGGDRFLNDELMGIQMFGALEVSEFACEIANTPIFLGSPPTAEHQVDPVFIALAESQHLTAQRPVTRKCTSCECPQCGKKFNRRYDMHRHFRIHTGENPYKCSICLKSFNQKQSLAVHSRIHENVRPFKCQVCSKAFHDCTNLAKHLRHHTGEQPYACHVCSMRFSISSHLHRHARTHERESHAATAKQLEDSVTKPLDSNPNLQ